MPLTKTFINSPKNRYLPYDKIFIYIFCKYIFIKINKKVNNIKSDVIAYMNLFMSKVEAIITYFALSSFMKKQTIVKKAICILGVNKTNRKMNMTAFKKVHFWMAFFEIRHINLNAAKNRNRFFRVSRKHEITYKALFLKDWIFSLRFIFF